MNKTRPVILAIDDTPENLTMLGAALASEFDVRIATSGPMGLTLAAASTPDLILLDVMMPGMDGFETCEHLKSSPTLKDIPVVFVTALTEQGSEIRGLALGAADYITKPINVEIARQRIRNLLNQELLRKEVLAQRNALEIQLSLSERQRQELVLSEFRFKAVIEASPLPFALNDAELNITYLNAAFIRTFGYTRDDIPTLSDWWPKAYPDPAYRQQITNEWLCHMDKAKQENALFEPVEAYIQCKNGEIRTVLVAAAPLSQSLHDLHAITFFDITERKQFQARLERMLTEQKAVLDNDLIGIVRVKDRKIVWANPAFEKMLGFGPGEANGTPTRQNYPSETAYLGLGEAAYSVLSAGKIFRSQIEHLRNDGRIIWVDVSGAMLATEGGESLWCFNDITERKNAEADLEDHRRHLEELVEKRTAQLIATEARATHLLQSSADGLYGVDQLGRITFINPAACQLLGRTAEDVNGKLAHSLFHHSKPDGSPYPVNECPSHSAVLEGQEIRVDNEVYWHADGHPIPVMYAVHPLILDGNNNGAVVSFVDMSEQHAATLAREKAIVAAENLARVRSEFLSNMSHEIRTPINGVLGFAEIGYRNYQNSEKARNAFEKILESGKRLLGVINDVLDFSKIEAGKLPVEQTVVSLNTEIEQVANVVRPLAKAKHLDLKVEISPEFPRTCFGDPLRMSQVLLNLISNAVKFTEVGSVNLSAFIENNTLIFRVSDTGIGMSEAQMHDLFVPFHQADGSTTRRFGGTGLGLTIAKRLAELMEGDIRVESRTGIGSTFEFSLPYVNSEDSLPLLNATAVEQPASSGSRLSGISILVAEDDPINQQVIELNLVEDGAHVVVVSNGRQAVERILQAGCTAFDIILMDMQMPVLGGLEAARQILELAPNLPIIGQTANAFSEDRDKCFAAGMVGYIAKPIDPEALVRLVLLHVMKQRGE